MDELRIPRPPRQKRKFKEVAIIKSTCWYVRQTHHCVVVTCVCWVFNEIQPCFSFWPSIFCLKLGVFLFGQILLKFRATSSGFDNFNSKDTRIGSSSHMITFKTIHGIFKLCSWVGFSPELPTKCDGTIGFHKYQSKRWDDANINCIVDRIAHEIVTVFSKWFLPIIWYHVRKHGKYY